MGYFYKDLQYRKVRTELGLQSSMHEEEILNLFVYVSDLHDV